jgi:hypothetical protein
MRAGSLPSKLFTVLASGRPVLACVEKESEMWRLLERAYAGVHVPPEDPTAFKSGILVLRDNKNLCDEMGKNGRNWAEKNHSPDVARAKLEQLLSQAIQDKKERHMNPEIFAEWMRRQGHQVFRTSSSYWYSASPHVLQAFPYHWLITPSETELHELMTEHGIISLRYSTPLGFPDGKISYHIIIHHPYNLDILKSQARNGIKRGLAHCKVDQITFERLATDGWILQYDTLDRQNRLRSMTQKDWERLCRSASDLPGFETWAAIIDGELAAALIVCQIDNIWEVPYALCHRKFLPDHANNALFYSVITNLLAREGVKEIFFTVQSLDAPPTVDEFKLRMGLMPKAVRQRVEFHPWLKPIAFPGSYNLLNHLLERDQGNPFIAKAEGMLRFYLDGKQDPSLQQWPECLTSQKEEILKSCGCKEISTFEEAGHLNKIVRI